MAPWGGLVLLAMGHFAAGIASIVLGACPSSRLFTNAEAGSFLSRGRPATFPEGLVGIGRRVRSLVLGRAHPAQRTWLSDLFGLTPKKQAAADGTQVGATTVTVRNGPAVGRLVFGSMM